VDQDIGQGSTRARAIADLFEDIVHEPCFNQLRTKEQLGYVVDCGTRMTHRVLGFCFRVQSSKHSPPYLQERLDAFIDKLQHILGEMDDKEFENYKVGLIAKKLEKDPSLIDETNRHWSQVVEKRYLFEMLKLEADELTSIQKSDVIDWYNSFINATSSKCRRLSIHVWGCNAHKSEAAESTKLGNVIDDVSAMKLTSEFYPSLC
jgi:nardilysin